MLLPVSILVVEQLTKRQSELVFWVAPESLDLHQEDSALRGDSEIVVMHFGLNALPEEPGEAIQAKVVRDQPTARLVWIEGAESQAGVFRMCAAAGGMFVWAGRAYWRRQLVGIREEALPCCFAPAL